MSNPESTPSDPGVQPLDPEVQKGWKPPWQYAKKSPHTWSTNGGLPRRRVRTADTQLGTSTPRPLSFSVGERPRVLAFRCSSCGAPTAGTKSSSPCRQQACGRTPSAIRNPQQRRFLQRWVPAPPEKPGNERGGTPTAHSGTPGRTRETAGTPCRAGWRFSGERGSPSRARQANRRATDVSRRG